MRRSESDGAREEEKRKRSGNENEIKNELIGTWFRRLAAREKERKGSAREKIKERTEQIPGAIWFGGLAQCGLYMSHWGGGGRGGRCNVFRDESEEALFVYTFSGPRELVTISRGVVWLVRAGLHCLLYGASWCLACASAMRQRAVLCSWKASEAYGGIL